MAAFLKDSKEKLGDASRWQEWECPFRGNETPLPPLESDSIINVIRKQTHFFCGGAAGGVWESREISLTEPTWNNGRPAAQRRLGKGACRQKRITAAFKTAFY